MKIDHRLKINSIWLPRNIAIYTIEIYRKYLSPYKGYHCAYARLYRDMSCSAFGKRVIHEHGLIKGLKLLQERFHQCNAAMLILYENNRNNDFEVRGCKLTGIKGCRIPHFGHCRIPHFGHYRGCRCHGLSGGNSDDCTSGGCRCHGLSGGNSDDCTSGGKDNTDCVSEGYNSEGYNIDYLPEGCDVTLLFDACGGF